MNRLDNGKRPDTAGWWWAKSKLGWTPVCVRMHGGFCWGLDPYKGEEFILDFPHDEHWDGVTEWAGPIEPPTDQGSNAMDEGRRTQTTEPATDSL